MSALSTINALIFSSLLESPHSAVVIIYAAVDKAH